MNLLAALLESSTEKKKDPVLSTGLTLLNLSLSGESQAGIESGSVVWISGPSDSGRSTLCLTLLAEASQNTSFANYKLVYDDTECQNLDIDGYFGSRVSHRILRRSSYGEQNFWNELMKIDQPCIYVLDSLDGLSASKTGWRVNNKRAGVVFDHFRKCHSILVLAAQEKCVDGKKKVAAGGFAVQFYADYSIRTVRHGEIYRQIIGKRRFVGTGTEINVVKTRGAGKKIGPVPAPVFTGSGYDNTESILEYLRKNGYVAKRGASYFLSGINMDGTLDQLRAFIRDNEQMIAGLIEGRGS